MTLRLLFLCTFLIFVSFDAVAQKNVVSKSEEKIEEFKRTDSKINKLFDSAYAFAMFPNIGKGGFWVGGANGNGTIYKDGKAVGDCRMTQVSVGFQFGGQKYAEVIFFENKQSYKRFIEGNYEFSAQASAVALKSGASVDAKYRDGVMVFTHVEGGLMYEAAIGGQKFKVNMY